MEGASDWWAEGTAGLHVKPGKGAAEQSMWDIVLCLSHQRYSYKYEDQPQQFSIQKANYIAANGVFHTVTALRWQLPPPLPGDPKVSQWPLFHFVL